MMKFTYILKHEYTTSASDAQNTREKDRVLTQYLEMVCQPTGFHWFFHKLRRPKRKNAAVSIITNEETTVVFSRNILSHSTELALIVTVQLIAMKSRRKAYYTES
jgi:hypothetical protein